MRNSVILKVVAAAAMLGVASMATAAPVCTKEPKTKWLPEAEMKAKVATMGYKDIKVFQVSGSCYEIYGHNKDGKKAEVYFNPVTGAVVQSNVD
jgi:hypothetical protein